MKIRTIIVEDELPAQRVLQNYIKDLPHLELVASFNNAIDAIGFIGQHSVDLILLDINLPKLSGLDFIKTAKHMPKVIITTAYPDFALEGFELDVVDYLLKPFSFQRFIKAIAKLEQKQMNETTLIKNEIKPLTHFFIKVDKVFYKIELGEVLFLKSEKDFVRIITKNKNHIVLQRLKYYEEILPGNQFSRIHKSYMVNLQAIEMVFGNTVRIEGYDLPIGRTYKDAFLAQLNNSV